MHQAVQTRNLPRWIVVFVGILIPLTLIVGAEFNVSQRIIIPAFVFATLMFGAMALWRRANMNATGQEWWQDDTSAGWRGG
jgi:hypothetical protein